MPTIRTQETASAALAVALIKPELSTDPLNLCAAAITCKGWKEAVHQCSACNTAVGVSLDAPLSRLCSFAQWLPQHAALVRSITFSAPHAAPHTVDEQQWEHQLGKAQQLVQQAMQHAYAIPPPATAAAAAAAGAGQDIAAAAQHHLHQQACLRLPTLSSVTFAGSTGMLAALPAASLTHLNLKRLHGPVHAPAVSAALARLSNLQQLHIVLQETQCDLPYSCLAAVAQLSRLTFLQVGHCLGCSGSVQQLQQLLLQPLPLRVLRFDDPASFPLDLSQLTHLEEIYDPCTLPGVVFPPQLQRLEIEPLWTGLDAITPALDQLLQAVMQLQQLQRLSLHGIGMALPLLHRLSELPALRQLALGYAYSHLAAAAAPVWPRLPLCEISIIRGDVPPSRREWQATSSAAAACTNLTRLELEPAPPRSWCWNPFYEEPGEASNEPPGTAFAKLAGLTSLEHLDCGGFGLSSADALRLTALTHLTHLELHDNFARDGDDAATAIARSCKQLRYLGLNSCNLVSMACLAEVRHLTQLTRLELAMNKGLTQQGLMSLTRLQGLEFLTLTLNAEVTHQVVESFWAVLKGRLQVKAKLLSYATSAYSIFMWRS